LKSPPAFWWRSRPGPAAIALWPAGRLYGAATAWRMARQPAYRAPIPVICVGNFVVGGAGKTPTALALARIARGRGMRPGFLTRGYGGSDSGPVLVDAEGDAERFGDEAPLLAASGPTVLSHDRAAGAVRLASERVDLIIMDDGMQNPGLGKDFHTYRLEWRPDAIIISFDGRQVLNVDPEKAHKEGIDALRAKMHLRINLALGGSWGGKIDDAALPARIEVKSFKMWSFDR